MQEQPLVGGAPGGVVRVGDTVRRPAGPSSPAVRALLLHLESVGFEGAPRHLGVDERGRDVLTWVEGDVALPPYPSLALTDAALDDLGRLLRRFHDATAEFDQRSTTGWAQEWADPRGGPVVCHDDLFPENVVFRDGHVVALVDLAEAAPGRRLWDLAVAAQEWAPLHAPGARPDHPDHLDGVRRTGRLARAYGLEPDQAQLLVDVVDEERMHALAALRARGTADEALAAADDVWLREQRTALLRVLG